MVASHISEATSGKEFRAERIVDFHGSRLGGAASCSLGHVAQCSVPIVGVCTTISERPPAVEDTARMFPDMPIVVVGDLKGPKNWTPPTNVRFYTVEQQNEHMKYFTKVIPVNHFGRKNIGYLLAIQLGACMIWDFDDDNFITSASALQGDFEFSHILGEGGSQLTMNPYNALGSQHFSWPRGYPIHMLKDHPRTQISSTTPQKMAVIQFLANMNPDVDAIYRLTRPIPFNFTASIKGVMMPMDRYSPFNAQATLFKKEAFWLLMLPMTVHGRVSDIWRSYIAQKILRASNLRWGFHQADVMQDRNAHSLLGDFNAELPLYQTASEFVRVIDEIQFTGSESIPTMLETIYVILYEHGMLKVDDVFAMQHWITAVCEATSAAPSK